MTNTNSKKKINKTAVLVAAAFFIGTLFPKAYSAIDGSLQKFKTLTVVMDQVQENYVEDTKTEDLVENAMKGVMENLDPFSEYMDNKGYDSLKADTKGEFGGIGIRFVQKDDYLDISTAIPGTPAFEAGILPQDRILFIDGKDVKEISQDDAVSMMRGKPGTKVKLTIAREDDKGEFKVLPVFTLKRTVIVPEVVFHKMINADTGYIFVTDFSGHTDEKFKAAMKALTKEGMKKLVLDLRFNPGGLLTTATDMAGMFLGENKMVVYTQGRKEEFYKEYKSPLKAAYPDMPLALLINEASASGSEIVAGALQDHNRAVVLGARSFGKASVQQVFPIGGGAAIRLTVARYYTPKGRLIQRDFKDKSKKNNGGIVPDVEIKITASSALEIYNLYNNAVYTPDEKQQAKHIVDDIVLDKAVEILSDQEKYNAVRTKELKIEAVDLVKEAAEKAEKEAKAKEAKAKTETKK